MLCLQSRGRQDVSRMRMIGAERAQEEGNELISYLDRCTYSTEGIETGDTTDRNSVIDTGRSHKSRHRSAW